MHIETKAIHAGMEPEKENRSVVPPIYSSTIFEHPESGLDHEAFSYTRHDNPNRSRLEKTLAALEGGTEAAAFSSGMAASAAVFQSFRPGDHIIGPLDLYHGTRSQLRIMADEWNLECDFVDMTEPAKVQNAIRNNTRLIWVETPSNPLLQIVDLKALSAIAGEHNCMICADNTWATPVLQQPLAMGADLVMHSTTKYLGGHSDLLGGVVIGRSGSFFERIRVNQRMMGAVPSPFDCWMLQRSIHTLPYRMKGHCSNAMMVAGYLANHPRIEAVFYPGLDEHTGHATAAAQMKGFGGMLSFLYKGNAESTLKVVGKSKLIIRATSLGGVESTWEHRFSSEGPQSPTPQNLVRLSVGLEHPDDILEDLEQALG